MGGALWICSEVASTGNLIGPEEPDFWKEGVESWGKMLSLASQLCPFLGPWVRALFKSVTFNPAKYALPGSHILDSGQLTVLWGRQQKMVNKTTKPSVPVLGEGAVGQQRESFAV